MGLVLVRGVGDYPKAPCALSSCSIVPGDKKALVGDTFKTCATGLQRCTSAWRHEIQPENESVASRNPICKHRVWKSERRI